MPTIPAHSPRFLVATLAAVIMCSQAAAQLATDLKMIVNRAALGQNGIAGIAVYDLATGVPLFEHNATTPLAPASNQKLLTSAAALKILGPSFAFETGIYRASDGSLVLVGSGDPSFGDPEVLREMTPPIESDQVFRTLAEAVAASITTATQFVIDDRVFDRELIHPDWPDDQLEKWYCAPVQGVNVHANVLAFYPEPSGGSASADLEPSANWIEITNRATVVSEGRNAVWIQRTGSDEQYILRGNIRTRAGAPIEVAMYEPALFAGRLLAQHMSDAGVRFDAPRPSGAVRLARDNEIFRLDPQPIARWITPFDDIAYRCNYDSMNLYAEALLKKIGNEITGERGSWQSGAAVLRMLIADTLGPQDAADTIIRDGSGLSRENRVTASTLARWLVAMHKDPDVRQMYLETLPTYDDKLARRLTLGETRMTVHAKTGTINYVRCLSGYVLDTESGRGAAFAILCNELRTGESIRASYEMKSDIIRAINDHRFELMDPADFAQLAQPEAAGSTEVDTD